MTDAGRHLSDEQLLRWLDGELASDAATGAKAHVEACWTCRSRLDQLERTISRFVQLRAGDLAESMPPPVHGRSRLEQALRSVDPSPISHASRVRLALHSLSAQPRLAITGLALLLCVLLLRVGGPERLSAATILRRTVEAERSWSSRGQRPVTLQKVKVRGTKHAVERTIYRDLASGRISESSSGASELRGEFERAGLDWGNPLSAGAFESLRQRLPVAQEEVRSSGDEMSVITEAKSGHLRLARLTVRLQDFHPIAQLVRFADASEIAVEEVSFQIVEYADLHPRIFGEPAVGEPAVASSKRTQRAENRPAPALPTDAELAEARWSVWRELHSLGADLREELSIEDSGGRVRVSGIASSAARAAEIRAALETIPLVTVDVDEPPPAVLADGVTPSPRETADVRPALLAAELENLPEREMLVGDVVSLASRIVQHAGALARFRREWNGRRLWLGPESADLVRDLEALYVNESLNAGAAVGIRLAPFLPQQRSSTSTEIQGALPAALRIQELCMALLADHTAPIGTRQALDELQHLLTNLEHIIRR